MIVSTMELSVQIGETKVTQNDAPSKENTLKLVCCWLAVYDIGPTLKHKQFMVLCLLG